jgi:hypothetical protein
MGAAAVEITALRARATTDACAQIWSRLRRRDADRGHENTPMRIHHGVPHQEQGDRRAQIISTTTEVIVSKNAQTSCVIMDLMENGCARIVRMPSFEAP